MSTTDRGRVSRLAAEYAVLLDTAPDMETIAAVIEQAHDDPLVRDPERDYLDTVADRRERLLRSDLDT